MATVELGGHPAVYREGALEPGASDHLLAKAALLEDAVLAGSDDDT